MNSYNKCYIRFPPSGQWICTQGAGLDLLRNSKMTIIDLPD